MSRHSTDLQESTQEGVPYLPLPADHVLRSGAVLFPGAFDQHGCPLIVFPVDGQVKLSSQLSKAEVVDFINYFLGLHNKKQDKESLVSVVADLRHASLPTARFIAETLLLLELHKPTVHSVYMIQPRKKDVVKALLKLLTPSKPYTTSFKKVLLKETSELSNYVDRSQLTAQLGGYFIYCHQSWVTFIKEMDAFVQEFLSVVQRLPSCISTLQALSRLSLPSTFSELQHFCSTNEAKFQQLRRELGLDELLHHCEDVLQKLRHPETEPCYQAMAGTALYTHTAYDMLQNHSRITAAVEKVDLLWHQAFSKARLQLQVFQLREEALQITEQIKTLQEKLQPYKIEIAKDGAEAMMLVSEFKASIHTPAMALVRCAEDVLHTLAEILPLDGHSRERWAPNLERLKDKLHSAVHLILQTLRAVFNYHYHYSKASNWYSLVLSENFLQELLSGLHGDSSPTHRQRRNWGSIPAWRHKMSTFLKKNPPPHMEELVHLAHLSKVIPDAELQQLGKQMSHRCMTLRKLLLSSGPVAVGHLQLALQWQYELLRSSHVKSSTPPKGAKEACNLVQHESEKEEAASAPGLVSAEGKPASLSSLDSGFDGAGGSSQLEAWGMRLTGTTDPVRAALSQPQIHTENFSSVSDSEDHREEFDLGSVGNSSRASIQIIPKTHTDSLNFEIKVKRSAALPSNPWLSLPVDDLENSYTVTITQNPTPQKREPQPLHSNLPDRSRDKPTQTEGLRSSEPRDWILDSQSSMEDPDLSLIHNVLSSTITEGPDKTMCTTEGAPTMLWDSYDLHDQNQDSVDGLTDLSLKDWDVEEQEGLRQVEEILERADEILEKEENVLAQEAVLDALLRSEDRHHQWPLWDNDEQHKMSSSELAEAGVIGLEDYLDHEGADTAAFQGRPDLLTELREVQVLDELIMEENLKIHKLRQSTESPQEEPATSKPSDTKRERESFRLQMEKEKREVEELEKSLDKEGKAKKHKDRARKVVNCSVMGKAMSENMEDRALCDEILSGCSNRSQRSDSLVDGDSHTQVTCQTEMNRTELAPDDAKEATTQDLVQFADDLSQDFCSEASPIVFDTSLISTSCFKGPSKEMEMHPQEYTCGTDLEDLSANAVLCKPKASSIPEMMPDDGAFDPGGISHPPPELKPTQALFSVNDSLAEQETSHSIDPQDPAQDPSSEQLDLQEHPLDAPQGNMTPAVCHNLVLNPNVLEHCNNNNNNQALGEKGDFVKDQVSETPSEGAEEPSLVPACLPKTDVSAAEALPPAEELPHQPPAPELPPDSPLEFNGQIEVFSGAVQIPQATRISGSTLPGIENMINTNIKEITDFNTPIVMDTGSGMMKAGFANEDLPKVIFPTIIGTPKYEEIMNGDLERDTYIGHEAQQMRGVLALRHPIKNGIITNWDEMEKIWHHTFLHLRVDPEDHPVLLTEAAMNPVRNRQRMVEIMFECFNVPFTYVAMQALLALYAAGRTTGVVLDSGDGVSHSVPVFEGYCLPHAVQRFPLAGLDVTLHLKKLLQEQGVSMRTTAEMEIVRDIKEKCCCVALDYEVELNRGGSSHREMIYTMPDGQIITLHTERFRAPEILFKPELIGRDHYGMHESVFKSILSSDIDLRRCLLGNIILSGGNTLLDGLPERLQAEIRGLVPSDMGQSVRVTSPIHRDFSVWSGGAALANMPSFSSAWISQEEYEEYGPDIVYRKCF